MRDWIAAGADFDEGGKHGNYCATRCQQRKREINYLKDCYDSASMNEQDCNNQMNIAFNPNLSHICPIGLCEDDLSDCRPPPGQ
jgi:glyoxylate carboligase